jgi:hypothetical protein
LLRAYFRAVLEEGASIGVRGKLRGLSHGERCRPNAQGLGPMRRAPNGSQRSRLGPHIVPYSMVRSAQGEGAAPAAAGDQEPIVRTPRPAVSTFSPTAAHVRKAQVPLGPGSLSSGSSSKGTRQLIIHSPRRSIPSVPEEIQAAHAFIATGVSSKRSKLQQDTSNE